MNDLISVIIPVYNVEEYISECIESVIAQSYNNLEIILVNDGSTDSSGESCDRYAAKDSRIRVIHKENGGQSSARNAGLEVASGEWIVFVDSDDVVHKELITMLRRAVDDQRLAMCLRDDFVDSLPPSEIVEKTELVDRCEVLNRIYTDNQYIVVWGKIYHMSAHPYMKDFRPLPLRRWF